MKKTLLFIGVLLYPFRSFAHLCGNICIIKFILIAATISICNAATAQNCDDKGRTVLMYPLEIPLLVDMNAGSDKKKNKKVSDQQDMMSSIAELIQFPVYGAPMVFGAQSVSQLSKSSPPSIDYLRDPGLYPPIPAETHSDYFLSGSINYNKGDNFNIHYELKASCSKKLIHAVDVSFKSPATGDPMPIAWGLFAESVANELIKKMGSLQDLIHNFEQKQISEDDKVMIDNSVMLTPVKKTLANGESTEVTLEAKKCDGTPIKNVEFTFQGTTGGTANPSEITIDAQGKAKFKFTKGNTPVAVLSANGIAKYPWGCNNDLIGSTAFGNMIKVEVTYVQKETKTLRRATLPGIKIEGGEITELIQMAHTSVLYHYPSPSALQKGYLVMAENEDPEPGSKTKYLVEKGYYDYSKNEQGAEVTGMIGDMEAVKGEEKGSSEILKGNASLSHPSQIFFYKGDANDPPQFSWDVDYNGKGGGSMILVKGEEGVKWVVNKITDPNSPYKTEYLLGLKLNAAEELKKGDKAMKDMFGFKLDDLAKVLDPTKQPQGSIAGASGSQTITVRILSPYPDETEKWVAPPKADLKDLLKQPDKK